MEPEEIFEVLAKITYKPNWTFRVQGGVFDSRPWKVRSSFCPIELAIRFTAKDSGDNSREIQLGNNIRLDARYFANKNHLLRFVFDQVMSIELHEAKEFFKHSGNAVYWPHADRSGMVGA